MRCINWVRLRGQADHALQHISFFMLLARLRGYSRCGINATLTRVRPCTSAEKQSYDTPEGSRHLTRKHPTWGLDLPG